MPYRYIYGGAPQLFHNNGVENVNTTIPAYTIKEIVRLSEYGTCPLAVVVDKGRAQERADLLMKTLVKYTKKEERTDASFLCRNKPDSRYSSTWWSYVYREEE